MLQADTYWYCNTSVARGLFTGCCVAGYPVDGATGQGVVGCAACYDDADLRAVVDDRSFHPCYKSATVSVIFYVVTKELDCYLNGSYLLSMYNICAELPDTPNKHDNHVSHIFRVTRQDIQ